MKKNRWYLRLLALLVLCGALNVTITAAAEAGSSDDPLVTLSYLNETFMDSSWSGWTRRSPPGMPSWAFRQAAEPVPRPISLW